MTTRLEITFITITAVMLTHERRVRHLPPQHDSCRVVIISLQAWVSLFIPPRPAQFDELSLCIARACRFALTLGLFQQIDLVIIQVAVKVCHAATRDQPKFIAN